MSDVPVYMIVNLQITDTDTYRQYEKGFFPLLKKYGGEFVTYDDNPLTMEGFSPREGRMILWKFPFEPRPMHGIEIQNIKRCPSTAVRERNWNF